MNQPNVTLGSNEGTNELNECVLSEAMLDMAILELEGFLRLQNGHGEAEPNPFQDQHETFDICAICRITLDPTIGGTVDQPYACRHHLHVKCYDMMHSTKWQLQCPYRCEQQPAATILPLHHVVDSYNDPQPITRNADSLPPLNDTTLLVQPLQNEDSLPPLNGDRMPPLGHTLPRRSHRLATTGKRKYSDCMN